MPNPTLGQTLSRAPSSGRPRLDYLDGLRALAALYVVLHHAFLQSWPYLADPKIKPGAIGETLFVWLRCGQFAVTVFIAISGFCLMLPVLRAKQLQGGVKGFALGRVRRILPPYYAALAISLILALCFIRPHSNTRYDVSLPVTHSGVLAHLLLVQDFHWSVYEINGPMWSIAVEVHIYLLFPLFVWLWKHLGILPVLVLSGILSLSLSHLVSIGVLRSPAPAYIFVFGLGMAAACFSYGEAERWLPRFSISLLATIAVISFVLGTWLFQSGRGTRSDFMIGISAACFLAILSRNATGSLRRRFSAKWLVLIGGFSYSLYLLHFPFQQLFWQWLVLPFHLSRMAGFLIVAGPGTVVILLLCYLFYRVFERPFMRQKPVV